MPDRHQRRVRDIEANLKQVAPYFLGSYGENNEICERILLEFFRDHVFWRRNFHPEDEPPISTLALYEHDYQAFVATMQKELHALSAQLKRSVPFFNPRYIGHMASDSLLPGLIAQLVTTLYNPNNVTEEAATATLGLELDVGHQLAAMIGQNIDEDTEPCAWGHLTSGGTVANYEGLWNARALKFYPLAVRRAAELEAMELPVIEPLRQSPNALGSWELMNLSLASIIELRRAIYPAVCASHGERVARRLLERVEDERIESRGIADFFQTHADCQPPVVLAPITAHYSWEKAMKVLGFGGAQLVPVPVTERMRMDAAALERTVEQLIEQRRPIMAVVAVVGSTEFGTIDPVHEVVALRQRWRKRGVDFAIHADAAWGGYIASLFRDDNGALVPQRELAKAFAYFPSDEVYRAFAALRYADFVTVDPHKLGYLPFGCGAFIARDRRCTDFISQSAPYVFDSDRDEQASYHERFRSLGQFILEGSKPGAAAAAAYVTHRVLPLDHTHFGRLPRLTIQSCEYLYDELRMTAERLRGKARLVVPFEPDTNLVCIAINPEGNTSLPRMNAFGRELYAHLRAEGKDALQVHEFFGSRTSLYKAVLGEHDCSRVLEALGIDPASFCEHTEDATRQSDHIFLLRHTLMNPWLFKESGGLNYMDRYCRYLGDLVTDLVERFE